LPVAATVVFSFVDESNNLLPFKPKEEKSRINLILSSSKLKLIFYK